MKRQCQALVVIALFSLPGWHTLQAQDSQRGPALGVARVSLVKGDVTLQRGDGGEWIQAQANMPLVEGDSLATGPGSRAELQLDYSNLVRIGQSSQVRLASLGNRAFRFQLERGILTYSELRGGEADVDIETPLMTIRPAKNGRYRVEMSDLNEAVVTVQEGEAEVASAAGKETLKKGRRMIVRGADQGVETRVVKAEGRDDWDEWNVRRDQQLKESNAYRYVSRSIYGAEDLDGYGRWAYVPSYGSCWFPSVPVGWAPYRAGRWLWLDYYGWSWLSYDPWGWAPYHYGRWFFDASYGWGWYPGSYYSYHYWKPALVAFFGYSSHRGLHAGLGVGFGHYGWIPLAPREPFYPWYGHGHRFWGGRRLVQNNTILVDNSINIYNSYRNARHDNGVTVVNARDFARGQVLNAHSLRAAEWQQARLLRGNVPVVPDRESLGQLIPDNRNLVQQRSVASRQNLFSRGRTGDIVARTTFDQQRQEVADSVRAFRGLNNHGTRQALAEPRFGGAVGAEVQANRARSDIVDRANMRQDPHRSYVSPATSSRNRLFRSESPVASGQSRSVAAPNPPQSSDASRAGVWSRGASRTDDLRSVGRGSDDSSAAHSARSRVFRSVPSTMPSQNPRVVDDPGFSRSSGSGREDVWSRSASRTNDLRSTSRRLYDSPAYSTRSRVFRSESHSAPTQAPRAMDRSVSRNPDVGRASVWSRGNSRSYDVRSVDRGSYRSSPAFSSRGQVFRSESPSMPMRNPSSVGGSLGRSPDGGRAAVRSHQSGSPSYSNHGARSSSGRADFSSGRDRGR
ncbi:MAG: DUF6600 domain-containing protein [Acidobacteriota bacterium]